MERLTTDAYYDTLYRGVWTAFQQGRQGVIEKHERMKQAREAAQQQRTG